MALESLLVPTELVAHEAYAHLSTPMLWRFLQEMPAQGDEWAARLVAELVQRCGERLPALWKLRLTPAEAPALEPWLASGTVCLGDLLRHPEARDKELEAGALFVARSGQSSSPPGPTWSSPPATNCCSPASPRRAGRSGTTLVVDSAAEYVLTAERRPVGWL